MPQIPRDVFFGDAAAGEEQPPAAVQPLQRAVEEDKVQVTVYLSPQMAKRLEALRFHLLNEYNVRVSKSALAEYAISQIAEELKPLADHFRRGER
jgi:hypothetical protein